jgi:hypothetical protein
MRVLGPVFLASVAATGCGSEEREKAEFRQHFLSQCAQTVRAQPGAQAGPDATAVCACVADKVFAGRSAAQQIQGAVGERQ